MPHARILLASVALVLLTACAPAVSSLSATPTPVPSPTPIPSPTPVPTATPIPPLALTIRWPAQVSALQPVPLEIELLPPPGIPVVAVAQMTVLDPDLSPYVQFDLAPREGDLYAAGGSLQLPLEPQEGDWLVLVEVWSALEVEGERRLAFRPTPIRFRDLTGVLPPGAGLRLPEDFEQVAAQGDQTAGARAWRYADGEIALWWAPGPSEPLSHGHALVMLEATYGADAPLLAAAEETTWQGRAAYLFREEWPGTGSPSEVLVIQGPDYWLYALCLRALYGMTIPPLLRQVAETFALD